MRKIIVNCTLAFIAIFFLTITSYAADVAKIGVINIPKIFESSSAGKAIASNMKNQYGKMRTELQGKQKEIKQLKENLEREAAAISKEKYDEKMRAFRIKINDFKSLEKDFKANLKRQDRIVLAIIQKDLIEIIKEIGKKEGFLLIIDKSAVLYSPITIDITDKITKSYNTVFAKGEGEAAKYLKKQK